MAVASSPAVFGNLRYSESRGLAIHIFQYRIDTCYYAWARRELLFLNVHKMQALRSTRLVSDHLD